MASTPGNRTSLTLPQAMQQAIAAYGLRDWTRAEEVCRLVLKVKADYFDALNLMGVMAAQRERAKEAEAWFARAAAADPTSAEAHRNRGLMLQKLKRSGEAVASYDRAIAISGDIADVWFNRGNALHETGQLEAALASYDRAVALKADYQQAWLNRGNVLQDLEQLEAAVASFDRAIALKPGDAHAHFNRGNAQQGLERYDAAMASYDDAIRLAPDHAEACNARGHALMALLQPDAAIASFEQAMRIRPEYWEAHCNRGSVLQDMKRVDEALAAYDTVIARAPDFAGAHWNKACTLLVSGRFNEGWRLFEWRWRTGKASFRKRDFRQPLWLGKEPLASKTILLHSEQGLGDTIQFCRYAPMVAARDARVVLEVEGPLVSLLRSLGDQIEIVTKGSTLPSFDFHCPLLSLPLAFHTDLATVPAQPYLHAEDSRVARWRAKLGERTRPRIGLVWAGGAKPGRQENAPFRRRDIKLALFAALRNEQLEFHSLQKGPAAEKELADLRAKRWSGPTILDHGSELSDFAETAALIETLDLVISVDTAVAHLAGAMGKPVWLLNRYDTCWRWLLGREDSPWYPSMRIFWQERLGDWPALIERVRRELSLVAGS